jgi:tetrahydrodipicolinate N-succinyltransferase
MKSIPDTVFAVGLGHKGKDCVFYDMVMTQQVSNFLRIISERFDYKGGNTCLNMEGKDFSYIETIFKRAKQNEIADFFKNSAFKDKAKTVICIMESNNPPENLEEAYLILKLFSNGVLNALNHDHRLPLTKIFASLPTIRMSNGGILGSTQGANDKFPSWLMFNDPLTNRFAPTSFARFGAHFGSNNTLMFGATVNIGVSIGDDNLLDSHCSVASCAQIGNRNKIGSFVSVEGVLSPINENPVIIGDDNFFGTNCRIGTGLVIGNKNFWGSGVDLSIGTPIRDLREGNQNFGNYVKTGNPNSIQGQDETMVILNRAYRTVSGIQTFPGEYLLFKNSPENQARFDRNIDLTGNN